MASMGGESWVTWSSGSVSAETQVGGALVSTAGQVLNPVPPGTPFEEIPDTWFCPVCGARKRDFTPYED